MSALNKVLAQRVLARRRLLQFTQMTHPSYSAGWVHADICARLEKFSQDVADRKSPRLMLLMPPRHGKSELASIRFPAWHLGHHPEHEIINVGYNLELPMKFSRRVRELIRDPQYRAVFSNTALDPDSQSVEAWNTTKAGGFTAAGVGGGITGKGAHILIIDDPLKNKEEADKAEHRDKLWDWYQSTAYTRLAPGGGVLCIECMTGDTPVMLADGSEKRLDHMQVGDEVATYEDGGLSTTTVTGWKHSGRDFVLKITMSSGRVVRANGRHPFLVSIDGELSWLRARALTTAHRIVVTPASGVSGKAKSASQTAAPNPPNAEGTATSTITVSVGPMGTANPASPLKNNECDTSNIAMGSRRSDMTHSSSPKAGSALSAGSYQLTALLQPIGKTSSASTIVTRSASSEGCSVTPAMSQSDSLELSALHSRWLSTSDFTTEQVLSIEPDGEEEVYDLQIARTENFIANGLVTHNTFWNDDDLAGRLQQLMNSGEEGADQFDVVRYPALSEAWEYRDELTNQIQRFPQPVYAPNLTLLRPIDTCLHEDRYPTEDLKRIRANLQPRIWSALYQQNPVPDEGMYFQKGYFRYQKSLPPPHGLRFFTAWDFAIGEKQQNDWTVGATIMQDETDTLYVVEVIRFKGDSYQIVEAILDAALRWGCIPTTGYLIGVEDGQIWRAIEPLFKKRMTERRQYPPYEPLRPMTDKLARARPLQGRMQQGRVVFPESAAWLPQAEQELLRFPAGAHDDVVDALAWAVHLCINKEPPRFAKPPPLPSWKDSLDLFSTDGASHMAA